MARNRNRKRAPQSIPDIPDLGKLHKPRKGNRKAAKLIESGVLLWDQRHIERSARRKRLKEQELELRYRERSRATEGFLKKLLVQAPSWRVDNYYAHISPMDDGDVRVEELLKAAEESPFQKDPEALEIVFRVAGITYRENVELRSKLPMGVTSYTRIHPRSNTAENRLDLELRNYDPRKITD